MTDLSKYKEIYLLESDECLQKLNSNLLILEKIMENPAQATQRNTLLDEMMRSSHTIKGSSASMGYAKTAYMTHIMEDVFDGARNEDVILNSDVINCLFGAVDALSGSLNSIKKNNVELDLDKISDEIKKMTGVNTVGVGKSVRNERKAKEGAAPGAPQAGQAQSLPAQPTPKAGSNMETEIANIISEAEAPAKIDYIKVPIQRLDTLMDLVEEFLIDKMRLEQFKNKYPDLKELSDHISLLTSSMQYEVMQARLVPVDQVFSRFPRMVRDLAKKLGKNIDLEITGGEIELDRTIVDKLNEPLVHLIRNAVDHGIASKGSARLIAVRQDDYVLIKVENDDQSINLDKVRAAAISRGIITEQQAAAMDEQEIESLIFHPRLSTKEEVTEISGRGVGLSVVKQFVESLGGEVFVENLEGGGVRFSLKLPLTVAIINSLLVRINNFIFAIPFSSIERSVSISLGNIKKMGDCDMAVVDGENVPLINLGKIFNFESLSLALNQGQLASVDNDGAKDENDNTIAVLIKDDEDIVGLVVDKLISDQEITIKPLSPVLRGVKGFSGSTILGDGTTILILDVINLIRR